MPSLKTQPGLSDFTNPSLVIDYQPGLSFSSMLGSSQAQSLAACSEYKVNLDNNRHTVKMNYQPVMPLLASPTAQTVLVGAANVGIFLSNEQIALVASRIASELYRKPP